MADEQYNTYHVAAAYVDGAGARVLEAALGRGADVTLVMPRNPNVYHDANRKVGSATLGPGNVRAVRKRAPCPWVLAILGFRV
jgi:hypothetical protein